MSNQLIIYNIGAPDLTGQAITMCNAFHERNQFYFFLNVSNTLSVSTKCYGLHLLPRVEPGDPVRETAPIPHMTEAPTAAPIDTQHELMATHPMLSPSLTRRWRPAAFLHRLQTLVASCTKHRSIESRWIRPDLPQWETATDLLARQHTHLYIHSRLG
jgi:hypothetical protein